jgi:hypothetical protein
MPKRSRTQDSAQNSLRIVEKATHTQIVPKSKKARSLLMAEMGSIGGKIGGKRRAASMTPEERKKAASLAAKARWGKSDPAELKREEGLRKIAQILEQHMTDLGLTEEQKNKKTELLITVVREVTTAKPRASSKYEESLRIAASRA